MTNSLLSARQKDNMTRHEIGNNTIAAVANDVRKTKIPFPEAPHWMTLLGTSEKGGRDYTPQIEGHIPKNIQGSLYRNGPGLFEVGGSSINHLLDGDGLIQRLSFSNGTVRYQNKFVETEKYKAEKKSQKRLYSTWTTRRSRNPIANFGGRVTQSQSGVTVYPVHGKILARDELGPTYLIDPQTLETQGNIPAGRDLDNVGFKAHSKLDPQTGEWIMAGTQFGPSMSVHASIYEPSLKLKKQFSFKSPRQVYIHDFIASKEHLIFVLHPCVFSPLPFLSGIKSFTDSFAWKGNEGNLIAVISRSGGNPKFFEAPGAFMWHALNAFEDGENLIADFIGYDNPDHFIGKNAFMTNIMKGYMGHASVHGKIRRYKMDLQTGVLREEIIDNENHEFPMLDERAAMGQHEVGYFATGGLGAFNSGLKRLNYKLQTSDVYDFGESVQVGEPIFAPVPGGDMDQGWLMSQCLDGNTGKTFFALFDAQSLSKGPVGKIWLEHHVPISFHGSWV